MSNEIIPMNLGVSKYADQKVFFEIAASVSWLPRLQLFGANTDAAKEGKIPMGHFGLVKGKEIIDCTKEVQVLVFSWRPKALKINEDKSVVTVFDPKSDEFKRIQLKSDEPDSGCMFGQRAA